MGSPPRSGSPQASNEADSPTLPQSPADPPTTENLADQPSSSDSKLPNTDQPEIKRPAEPNISKPSDSPYIERRSPNVGSPSRPRSSSHSPRSDSPAKLPKSPLISRSPLGKQRIQ